MLHVAVDNALAHTEVVIGQFGSLNLSSEQYARVSTAVPSTLETQPFGLVAPEGYPSVKDKGKVQASARNVRANLSQGQPSGRGTKRCEGKWFTAEGSRSAKNPRVTLKLSDRLQVGGQLDGGQSLTSQNGRFNFAAQKDGKLVIYGPEGVKWASGTQDSQSALEGYRMTLGEDDNLHWFKPGGGLRWSCNTKRREQGGKGALIMRDDGLLTLKSDNVIIGSNDGSKVGSHEPVEGSSTQPLEDLSHRILGDRLVTVQSIYKSQSLRAHGGVFELLLQGDGNLVLYRTVADEIQRVLWASGSDGTVPKQLVVQTDGNVVLYTESGAVWASNTRVSGLSQTRTLVLKEDGNLVLEENGNQIWELK
ncbi:CHAP domain-containing protein [Paramyrothecium foliicola]|nr:CHAP domain-containing protein [Paramyrothecium foliicola]